jgi:hypothetical protein
MADYKIKTMMVSLHLEVAQYDPPFEAKERGQLQRAKPSSPQSQLHQFRAPMDGQLE